MSWITIPNEVVRDFTGRPMKRQKVDNDREGIFHPIVCKAEGCDFKSTNLREFNEHILIEHRLTEMATAVKAELEEATTARLILDLLLQLGDQGQANPLTAIRRPNDAIHSAEVWRRTWLARNGNAAEIRLKKPQYDWLQQLLDRKVPLAQDPHMAKLLREEGREQESLAMYVYGLSAEEMRRAFTTLPDRKPECQEDEEPGG